MSFPPASLILSPAPRCRRQVALAKSQVICLQLVVHIVAVETLLRCNSLKYHLRRELSSIYCGVLMVDGTLKRGETEGSNYIWDNLKIVLVFVHFDKKL